ncbi:unnamed protein product [Rotaria sordida]|uniref:Uncharacterized protein n=1 Tax=Rotaria sordida TaxID=392033 RepID=A0A819RCY1_9BILA|nr:unnamed protein product [Rotaria sordida]CAF4044124.1 unnamed protein product [Rotaria sordida]
MMNLTTTSKDPIISNSFVTCYPDRLVIHLYYFPYGNKTIKYTDIQSCELLRIADLSILKRKMWGMALSSVWWHADFHRHWREYYILLDTNQWLKIGITMNDDDIINVYKLIKEKIDSQQSTETSSEKKSFDDIGKVDTNVASSMSEKELEYQKSLESNKEKYI